MKVRGWFAVVGSKFELGIGQKRVKFLGKSRRWWWGLAKIVQRSERRIGRTIIQGRWIPGERVFILSPFRNNLRWRQAFEELQVVLRQLLTEQRANLMPSSGICQNCYM